MSCVTSCTKHFPTSSRMWLCVIADYLLQVRKLGGAETESRWPSQELLSGRAVSPGFLLLSFLTLTWNKRGHQNWPEWGPGRAGTGMGVTHLSVHLCIIFKSLCLHYVLKLSAISSGPRVSGTLPRLVSDGILANLQENQTKGVSACLLDRCPFCVT